MTHKDRSSAVHYQHVGQDYLKSRQLHRHGRTVHLWAMGVGAVISGDFFGWNFGLGIGGFGGMLVATGIITILYFCLAYSIAEMSAALPHAGAAYSFARTAMGPWGAYVTGLAENMEYLLAPTAIVVGVGAYLQALVPSVPGFVWWLVAYAVFTFFNIWGVAVTFRVTVVITILALVALLIFFVGAIPLVEHRFLHHANESAPFFPNGWRGVFETLPYAIWFYLAIEQLPLAAEETIEPQKEIPRALTGAMVTLAILSFLVLYLNSSIPPGVAVLASSEAPLNDGFRAIFGEGARTWFLSLVALAGLLASFHSIIFAYGRQIYSLSRAGYFPRVFSLTHPHRKTPYVALLMGSGVGLIVTYVVSLVPQSTSVGAVLLNMSIFGAVISYVLQMVSFVLLRVLHPHLVRPYRSPLGIPGAIVAGVISVLTLLTLFSVESIRGVMIGVAVWYGLGLLYFVVFARHRLVAEAPEEALALSEQ